MSAPPRIPGSLSAWCDAADLLGHDDGHTLCPGNWAHRLPWQTPTEPPLQTYTCGCTCHQGDQQ